MAETRLEAAKTNGEPRAPGRKHFLCFPNAPCKVVTPVEEGCVPLGTLPWFCGDRWVRSVGWYLQLGTKGTSVLSGCEQKDRKMVPAWVKGVGLK